MRHVGERIEPAGAARRLAEGGVLERRHRPGYGLAEHAACRSTQLDGLAADRDALGPHLMGLLR